MGNDFLSQEEIDALLSRAADDVEEDIEEEDKDLLGEIGNICMGSASTTLSILINQPVSITTPKVKLTTLRKMKDNFEVPNIAIEVRFSSGLGGANLLVLKMSDAGIIADLMMGGKGVFNGTELSEIQISAVSEAMNQMIGTAATSMAQMFKKEVNISPPTAIMWDSKADNLSEIIDEDEKVVQVSFRLTVGSLIDSEIMQLLPMSTSKDIIDSMTAGFKEPPQPPAKAAPVQAPAPIAPRMEPPMEEFQIRQQVETRHEVIEEVPVHRAQFMPFENQSSSQQPRNIDLILDVPIEVSVILGRTRKTIKEVLDLNNGSLIELDKLVEEPVEILVNGKMVAEGEVVVVNENFGVRITNIISNVERVRKLQGK